MWLPDTPQDSDNRKADRVFSDEWLPELESIMQDWDRSWSNLPYSLPLKDSTGLDCWRDMFDDGLTPEQAFAEDQLCWV